MMKKPALLHKGDRVAIVATARKVGPEEIATAVKLFEKWELQVVLPDGLHAEYGQLAGSDEHRARLMQEAIDAPDIKAVFCARGGYGTVRIIDQIDWTRFAENSKWIVGYSDVTVLHSHIHRHCGTETLHATMPINITSEVDTPATETLRRILFGLEDTTYQFEGHFLNRCGTASATVVGGNLSILYSLCGSPSDIDTEGKILLIEDLDEYLYHIDRMMQNLRRCGKLARLKGLIVGGMTDMHDNSVPFGMTVEEIVRECVKDYDYPVCFQAPFGHLGDKNLALPLGRKIELSVEERNTKIHIPCC